MVCGSRAISARRSTRPMATSAPSAPRAEIGDHRRVEQGMVGGRHQQRPARRRIGAGSPRASRRWSPPDGSTVSRGSVGQHRGDALGLLRQHPHRVDLRRWRARRAPGRATIGSPADRDQRLEVGAVAPRRTDRRPGRDPASSSAVQRDHASQLTICRAALGAAHWPAPAAPRGRSARANVHSATSSSPMSGRPNTSDDDQDHHVGVAPRGDQPELAVDRPPDVDVHPVAAHEDALDDPLRRHSRRRSPARSALR